MRITVPTMRGDSYRSGPTVSDTAPYYTDQILSRKIATMPEEFVVRNMSLVTPDGASRVIISRYPDALHESKNERYATQTKKSYVAHPPPKMKVKKVPCSSGSRPSQPGRQQKLGSYRSP